MRLGIIIIIFLTTYLFKIFIYLFLDRGEGWEKERERNISCGPHWGPGPQPRHVPWLGVEPGPFASQPALNPLSYTSQGEVRYYYFYHTDEENGAQNNDVTEPEGSEQRVKARCFWLQKLGLLAMGQYLVTCLPIRSPRNASVTFNELSVEHWWQVC